jgi:NAD(P)-dependent dehydrogenase (short-subunit alcohol dehydrogenase family)
MSARSEHPMSDKRVVLVTGASGGVGRGIAHACATVGWTVWIAARREAEGNAVAKEVDELGGEGRFVQCDAGIAESVEAAVDQVVGTSGQLHGVVHNATSGMSPRPVVFPDVPIADLEDHVAVALRGLHVLARCTFPHLRETGGAMVVLTSEAGFEGKAKLSPYAGVKAAQRGIVRGLAREWGPHGVRVNCIAPLATTPALEQALVLDPEMAARLMGRNPLRRLGDPDGDIGPVVRFLLSADAAYVTGNTVMVDGGACPIN